jgi:cell cycle arrest protein BUB3
MNNLEYELQNPPQDGITTVIFSPHRADLLVSSWDSSVRLYDVASNRLKHQYTHSGAVLDCCFKSDHECFSASLDRTIQWCDLTQTTDGHIGEHDEAVRCLAYAQELEILYSGSWDKTLKAWDVRQPSSSTLIQTHILPEKVFTMDVQQHHLIVGLSKRLIYIYDTRQMKEPMQKRESSLKYMTRCIRGFPSGEGFAIACTEGRVAVELIDPSDEAQSKKYAFKCHRETIDGSEIIYPVHSLAFHPT